MGDSGVRQAAHSLAFARSVVTTVAHNPKIASAGIAAMFALAALATLPHAPPRGLNWLSSSPRTWLSSSSGLRWLPLTRAWPQEPARVSERWIDPRPPAIPRASTAVRPSPPPAVAPAASLLVAFPPGAAPPSVALPPPAPAAAGVVRSLLPSQAPVPDPVPVSGPGQQAVRDSRVPSATQALAAARGHS